MSVMPVKKQLKVPTGDILVVEGHKGKLELVSLGDYGKKNNIKADFLGFTEPPEPVEHQEMQSLYKKWVITISSQYGCNMNCKFCDVPMVGSGKNATKLDLIRQVLTGLDVHPEINYSERLNIHFARMGEPSWNPHILDATMWLKEHVDPEYNIHPVVSTMMPKDNEWLKTFIHKWMSIKNRHLRGEAGLQLSINSTDEDEREDIFSGNALPLHRISQIMEGIVPVGRKMTLNFPVCDWEIDPKVLKRYFSPEKYIVKLTPMHKTSMAEMQGIRTEGDYTHFYPYQETEEALKDEGYDVIVFVASEAEDKGLITCGNAILSGRKPETEFEQIV